MKRKKKPAGMAIDLKYGEFPFFAHEENSNAADAARYRWLRDNKAKNNANCWHFQSGPILEPLQSLDAAIDAAMHRTDKEPE